MLPEDADSEELHLQQGQSTWVMILVPSVHLIGPKGVGGLLGDGQDFKEGGFLDLAAVHYESNCCVTVSGEGQGEGGGRSGADLVCGHPLSMSHKKVGPVGGRKLLPDCLEEGFFYWADLGEIGEQEGSQGLGQEPADWSLVSG